jgi:tetratricopeptide (TPR) repeat protein
VLRVLPARISVLLKLGYIRSRQGLAKEAESYYLSFLDKAAKGGFDPAEFLKLAGSIAEEMPESPVVLDRLAESLEINRLDDEAGNVLIKLFVLHEKVGDSAGAEKARAAVERLGFAAKLDVVRGTKSPAADNRTVITEDDLWTKTHSQGERIEVESTPRFVPPTSPSAPAPQPTGAAPAGPSERDLYLLRLARGSAEPRPAPAGAPAAKAPAGSPAAESVVATETPPAATAAPEAAPQPEPPADPAPRPAKADARPSGAPASPGPGGNGVQISALFDDETLTGGGEEDYRSHYDLGMAYLEMDLLSEAIREYQVAAKSAQFQVKCLEMIGLCFIKQSQPQLAIRQLTKGLALIGADSEESLGIKYNLGLAYEMVGDHANARTFFEDVYVVDVTFRDVSEKLRQLSGSS